MLQALESSLDEQRLACGSDTQARRAADILDEVDEARVRGDVHVVTLGTLPQRPPEVVDRAAERVPGMVQGPEARVLRRRSRYGRHRSALSAHDVAIDDDALDVLSSEDVSDTETTENRQRIGVCACVYACWSLWSSVVVVVIAIAYCLSRDSERLGMPVTDCTVCCVFRNAVR